MTQQLAHDEVRERAREKKVILVTGGSRGIGRATCILSAQRGYDVVVAYKENARAAADVVAAIDALNGNATAIPADLETDDGVLSLFKELDDRKMTVTALVNNAGDSGAKTSMLAIPVARLEKIFKVNFFSAFRCSQEAARRMKERKCPGAIVNVSSVSVQTGGAGFHVDYAAMKAAIESMTRGLARELARSQIRVNAVSPGPTHTDMTKNMTEEERAGVKDRTPLKRFAYPWEIAEGILWLLSDQASFVTGTVLKVAGGR
jgi:NAD(P)-dependent dehydrogenase (short-subunit alcohol dehydrogenase family)